MPTAGIIGRRSNRRRGNSRRDTGLRNLARPTAIGIVSATADGNEITVVFNQPVLLDGVPQFLKNGTIAPTSAAMSGPTTLVLTYPAGPEATELVIDAEDAAVRNTSGGYVTPTTFPV